MELENQFSSLELAKKLKELGVPQKAFAYWKLVDKEDDRYELHYHGLFTGKSYAAFTASELGEILPATLVDKLNDGYRKWFECSKTKCDDIGVCWKVSYRLPFIPDDEQNFACFYEKTEADARAKILIYLIKNNLLDPKKL